MYPVDRHGLILHSEIRNHLSLRRLRGDFRVCKEAEQPQPVADHNDNDTPPGNTLRVKFHFVAIAVLQAASMNIDKYRQLFLFRFRRRENIQIQAVLTHFVFRCCGMQLFCIKIVIQPGMNAHHCHVGIFIAFSHALPVLRGTGRFPAKLSHRRLCIGNSSEYGDSRVFSHQSL